MNPAEWLVRTAIRMPCAPALLRGETVLADYAEFARRAGAIGAGLRARGLRAGDRIALFMENSTAYLEALYGIWFMGGVVVPINGKLHVKEAEWIIENAGARLAFVSDKGGGGLAAPGLQETISVTGAAYQTLLARSPLTAPTRMKRDQMAWLFYTSGTTGKPKGVMLSCGNIEVMTYAYFIDVDEVLPRDAILYAAPMSHGAGIYNFMHVLRGARHVVPESGGFDAGEILTLAPKLGHVSMFAAPTMVRRLVEAARAAGTGGAGLKTVVYAGGPMYVADIIDAVQVMGSRFVQVYGQGECPMCITALGRDLVADRVHANWRARLGSVGVAQAPVLVRVVDETGAPLSEGEVGEITVAGAPVMLGYWQNPEATAAALRGGWLWTGDMGEIDAEGFVTLHDRSKDMIISGGSNIYPREVEEVLLTHPDVGEVAVVGRKSAEWGEEVVAFVVPNSGMPNSGVPDPADLDALCLARIARFKRPKDYVIVPDLPKNNYGKVLKTALRKILEEKAVPD